MEGGIHMFQISSRVSSLQLLMCRSALLVFAGVLCASPAVGFNVEQLDISGELRDRYEVRSNASFSNPNGSGVDQNNSSYLGQRLRLNLGYTPTTDVKFFVQFQDSRLFGAEAGTLGNSQNTDVHQGYMQIQDLFVDGLQLRLGRQEIYFGDHRVLGNVGWTNVGRSFDGARATYERDVADLDVIWVRTKENDVTDVAFSDVVNFPGSPAAVRKGANDQDLYIAYGTIKAVPNVSIEPYWILLVDNGVGGSVLAPAATNQHRHTLGLRIDGTALSRALDYTAEFDYQTGSIASGTGGSTARDLDITAGALALDAGYTFQEKPWRPRLGVGYDWASGDGDNNTGDNQGDFNTFENLYPTNHGHYGIMDLVGWRNIQDIRFSMKARPTPTTGISLDYHIFRLADTGDNWYRFNGATMLTAMPGNQAASLGQELDITAFTTIKDIVKLGIGYGHFFAGEFIEKNNLGAGGNSFAGDQDWMYLMATLPF